MKDRNTIVDSIKGVAIMGAVLTHLGVSLWVGGICIQIFLSVLSAIVEKLMVRLIISVFMKNGKLEFT